VIGNSTIAVASGSQPLQPTDVEFTAEGKKAEFLLQLLPLLRWFMLNALSAYFTPSYLPRNLFLYFITRH